MSRIIKEALQKLKEENELVPVSKRNEIATADDLDKKLLAKINSIAKALKAAFEDEGIDLDADLIAKDMIRDCGLMGGIVDDAELDVENNPFDAATKQMHDMGPVDRDLACQTLLNVQPHEFVAVFLNGLKRDRNLLPPGARGQLPGPNGRRALPHRPAPRRIGEDLENTDYIEILVKKFAPMASLDEELLVEKITDLHGHYNRNVKDKFEQKGLTEEDFNKMANLDPTHQDNTNGGGSYIEWLTRLILKGYTTYEEMMHEAHEYQDQLQIFDEQKKRNRLPAERKDIMQYRSLQALMQMLQDLGAAGNEEEDQMGGHSDFVQEMGDIRAALRNLIRLEDRQIPQEIQNTSDVFEFIGGNNEWDLIMPKNYWGTAILDKWGKGAGWCVGGMLGSNSGMNQIDQAKHYYNNYAQGRNVYLCIQNKDKNASRPTNKYLITLSPDGQPPYNATYQFNDASNNSVARDGRWGANWNEREEDAFSAFLIENGLFDILKNSRFKNCPIFSNAENIERLQRGEPFEYTGGRIRDNFRAAMKVLEFTDSEGNKCQINTEEHPEVFNAISINDMENFYRLINGQPFLYTADTGRIDQKFIDAIQTIEFVGTDGEKYSFSARDVDGWKEVQTIGDMTNLYRLSKGEPYVYDGGTIKSFFKPSIKTIIFPENYDNKVDYFIGGSKKKLVGIPNKAFENCSALEKVYIPPQIKCIGWGAFLGCPDSLKIIASKDTKLSCYREDRAFVIAHYEETEDFKMAPAIANEVEEDLDVNFNKAILVEKITDLHNHFKKNYEEKFKALRLSEEDFNKMANLDPTHTPDSNGGGSYIEWLARLIMNKVTTFRQMMQAANEYRDQLSAFDNIKKRNQFPKDFVKKDIMQVKDLKDLMDVVVSRGKEIEVNDQGEQHVDSDFQSAIKDIPALMQKLNWPVKVNKTADDIMELVFETSDWECWKIKQKEAAYIFDRWGEGAKWCVGGFGIGGREGMNDCEQFYPRYLNGGNNVYVCFQRKDKNAERPYNKALITFIGPDWRKSEQFNHANNHTYYSDKNAIDDDETDEELATFLTSEGLLDKFKNSEFGNNNAVRLADSLQALNNGEAYIYDGTKIKDVLRPLIKKVKFSPNYDKKDTVSVVDKNTGEVLSQVEGFTIPRGAFRNCTHLEDVELPDNVVSIEFGAFRNCNDDVVIRMPYKEHRGYKLKVNSQEREWLQNHIKEDKSLKTETKVEK